LTCYSFAMKKNRIRERLVTTKSIFVITLIVVVLTILSIWLFGLGERRTLFENSLLSISILSFAFFLFITVGLYKGIKMKDNVGKITNQFSMPKAPNVFDGTADLSALDLGIDAEGCLMWIVLSVIVLILLWFFGIFMWFNILVFSAMLYWIFFRALRLVFKKSGQCQGDLKASMRYGFTYTLLYNFWIYGIILILHYIYKKS